ncbi:hypothetical protein GCM10027447_03870 [Glycomyces halotolerans]
MSWIDVDADKLETAASTIRGTAAEVEHLAEYAREADPDWWMWGLGGIPFAALYFGVAEMAVHPALEDAAASIEGLADRLDDCARDHRDNDDEIAAELEKIGQDIDEGAL